jgi:MFS family permease
VTGNWRSVAAVAGWQLTASLCYYSIFASTGVVRDVFGLSETLVGFFVTAALFGYTIGLIPSGAAVDSYGEKPVMAIGLSALAIAVVALSFAQSYWGLLLNGIVLGIAYSTAMPGSNRGILDSAPPGRENLAMGIKQVGVTAGSAIASLLITGIAAVAAWQLGFWIIAVLAGGYVISFVTIYVGSSGTGTLSFPDFSRLQSNQAYLTLVITGLFVGTSLFAMLSYIVLYVQDVLGASAAISGLVLALTQVAGSAARIGAGGLADRLGGAHGAATVALGQVGLAVVFFAILAVGIESLSAALAVFTGLGVTIYGSVGVFYSCLGTLVEGSDIGAATAGGQTAINVGGLVAPPVFGVLVEAAGYRAGWALLCLTTFLSGLSLAVVRYRIKSEPGDAPSHP